MRSGTIIHDMKLLRCLTLFTVLLGFDTNIHAFTILAPTSPMKHHQFDSQLFPKHNYKHTTFPSVRYSTKHDDDHKINNYYNENSKNLEILNVQKQVSSSSLSRRESLSKASSSLLSFLFISSTTTPSISFAADSTTPESKSNSKTVVITGCNSGIGYNAALRMAMSSSPTQQFTIILACRTLLKAKETMSQIESTIAANGGSSNSYTLIPAECDLADLSSIKEFVSSTVSKTQNKLDVVCLNAGIALNTALKEVPRTKDGFELTIGTNHLGHFYLNSLLLPLMDAENGRIVITASGVHDPESPGGAQGSKATLGNLKGLEDAASLPGQKMFDMVDGGPYDADKAYKDSKLCNVLFTRELQKRLDASKSGIKAYCFNPGLIVGTGLFRYQNPIFTKVFDLAATNVFKVAESTSWGGGALEYLALSPQVGNNDGGLYFTSPPGSSKYGEAAYGKEFTPEQVSKEASDDLKASRLWLLSEKLVGISSS